MIPRRELLRCATLGMCGLNPGHEEDPLPAIVDPEKTVTVTMTARAAFGLQRALATGVPMTGPEVSGLVAGLRGALRIK